MTKHVEPVEGAVKWTANDRQRWKRMQTQFEHILAGRYKKKKPSFVQDWEEMQTLFTDIQWVHSKRKKIYIRTSSACSVVFSKEIKNEKQITL